MGGNSDPATLVVGERSPPSGDLILENTAQGAGEGALVLELQRYEREMTEGKAIKRFWMELSKLGVGTNAIEARAKGFRLEQQNKNGSHLREGGLQVLNQISTSSYKEMN